MDQHDVVVVGGGNAGVSLTAKLLRDGLDDVALVEGQQVHHYRPLLNYVGAGEATMGSLERPMRHVVPHGRTWIDDEVVSVDPEGSMVHTRGGRTVGYRTLVLCPSVVEDWDATPGLRAAYAEWAGSTYVVDSAPLVWQRLSSLRKGSVVFTVPPEPAPCAATAIKPLLMTCDHWRREGVLSDMDVRLVLPDQTVTGLPQADERLERTFASYGVEVLREARVAGLVVEQRRVRVETSAGPRQLDDLAYAHVVPHYRVAAWVTESGLGDGSAAGLVDVDAATLRRRPRRGRPRASAAAECALRRPGATAALHVAVRPLRVAGRLLLPHPARQGVTRDASQLSSPPRAARFAAASSRCATNRVAASSRAEIASARS